MSCCKPQYTVISATEALGILTLTVNKLFTDIGQNAEFRLCITTAMIPANDTSRIQLTDGVTTLDCFLACTGNYLRADSLRSFLCHNARGGCCPSFNFCCYRGSDPAHVTFQHRMCASTFTA